MDRKRQQAEKRYRQRFSRRAVLLGAAQLGLFGVLGARLHHLQVGENSRFSLLAEDNRINLQLLAPERGRIVDRFGRVLASNRENLRLVIVPDRAGDLEAVLDRVARIVRVDDAERRRILRRAARQNASLPIEITNNLSWDEFARVNVLAPELPGVEPEVGFVRQYHHGSAIGHVVGHVGSPDRFEVGGDPVLRLPGMRIGKTGVERGLENGLRGRAGTVKVEVNARGRVIRSLDKIPPVKGADAVLTIDYDLQRFATERLAKERAASVVALDTVTGDVLAMASTPTYDPNRIVFGMDEEDWRNLAEGKDDPLLNRAIRGQYPPGSTFKIVTALAGLQAGVITAGTRHVCRGSYAYSGQTYRCWKRRGHGTVRLRNALQESCDVYFYEVARQLGIDRLAATARMLGLGEVYDSDLPLQKPGIVPDDKWKRSTLGLPWYGGETVIAGIGQGFVLTTPLQLAVMTARVASGRVVVPRLARPRPGEADPVFAKLAIEESHLAQVRTALHAAVNLPGGTALGSRLKIPGVTMAGKTGTSQVKTIRRDAAGRRYRESTEWKHQDHSLFVGYAPEKQPRYAVAAVVEHGGGGSKAAAPLVRDVMTELVLRDPMSRPAVVPEAVTPVAAAPSGNGEG